jgi:hypothetical protein
MSSCLSGICSLLLSHANNNRQTAAAAILYISHSRTANMQAARELDMPSSDLSHARCVMVLVKFESAMSPFLDLLK